MIYIAAALYQEALPFIERFRMKKQPFLSRFQLFGNGEMLLVITGTGPLNAAIGTTALLTRYPPGEDDAYVNIGICGAANPEFRRGQGVLCHKIVHRETNKTYFPDMLSRHPWREGVLETHSRPVTKRSEITEGDIVDMEGAGCFEGASVFLAPHRMAFVKIVSDDLENANRVAPGDIPPLLEKALPSLEEFLSDFSSLPGRETSPLSPEEAALLENVAQSLKLTAFMRHQLRQYAAQYKIRTNGSLEFLARFASHPPANKNEGKMIFARIKERLLYP